MDNDNKTVFDVSLRYSSVDSSWVERFIAHLEKRELRRWLDHEEVSPNDLMGIALTNSFVSIETVVFVASTTAVTSGWLKEEEVRIRHWERIAEAQLLTMLVELDQGVLPQSVVDSIKGEILNSPSFDDGLALLARFATGQPSITLDEIEEVPIRLHLNRPELRIAGEWRNQSKLKGRFHPDYPDDLEVIIYDGSKRTTQQPPERVWVRITASADNLFEGILLNQPYHLKTVKQGDLILFMLPENSRYPLMLNRLYLRERQEWVITPCNRCGFGELFDPPSKLIQVIFPSMHPDAKLEGFTTFCGLCGGVQVVRRKA